MSFCTKCGNRNEEGDAFCTKCGAEIRAAKSGEDIAKVGGIDRDTAENVVERKPGESLSVEGVLREGFELYKRQFVTFTVAAVIVAIGSILFVTAPPLFFGLYYMALKGINGEDVKIGDLFKGFNYLVESWLVAFAILFGSLFYFIPGLILIILFQYAVPVIVSGDKGIIKALKRSYSFIRENLQFSFILGLILLALNISVFLLALSMDWFFAVYLLFGWLLTVPFTIICYCLATPVTLKISTVKKEIPQAAGTASISFESEQTGFLKKERWTIRLTPEYAEFSSSKKSEVISVPKDQGDDRITFDSNVFLTGYNIGVKQDGKTYKIKLAGDELSELRSWMPEKTFDDLKKVLRSWGRGLIAIGVISILLAEFLDPVWGFILIVIGVLELSFPSRKWIFVNGIGLVLVGVLNIVVGVLDKSGGWAFFGLLQIFWGYYEIPKYKWYPSESPDIEQVIVSEEKPIPSISIDNQAAPSVPPKKEKLKETSEDITPPLDVTSLLGEITDYVDNIMRNPKEKSPQDLQIDKLVSLGPDVIPEIESAIWSIIRYGDAGHKFNNGGLLCEAIGKIGGDKTFDILSQFAIQDSNVAEYWHIRFGAVRGLAYLSVNDIRASEILQDMKIKDTHGLSQLIDEVFNEFKIN